MIILIVYLYIRRSSMTVRLTWLGHASVKITSPSITIYIDPWKIDNPAPHADIILLTHDHYDHYSQADLKGSL